jgi:hypothetical protein
MDDIKWKESVVDPLDNSAARPFTLAKETRIETAHEALLQQASHHQFDLVAQRY